MVLHLERGLRRKLDLPVITNTIEEVSILCRCFHRRLIHVPLYPQAVVLLQTMALTKGQVVVAAAVVVVAEGGTDFLVYTLELFMH